MAKMKKTCQHAYMTKINIFTVPNIGRGHCLFASLADQVWGSQDQHLRMRKEICQYIRDHAEEFFQWIDVQEELETGRGKRSTTRKKVKNSEETNTTPEKVDEETTDHFAALNNRMDRMEGREWGDEIEIAGFCQAFDTDVILFTPTGLRVLDNPKHDEKLPRNIVHVAYGGEERYPHYESIRKFNPNKDESDSLTNESTSRESSEATENSKATETSNEKPASDVAVKSKDSNDNPHGHPSFKPKNIKTIEVFELTSPTLNRRDIKHLLEEKCKEHNVTLGELIRRDKERSRSLRSSRSSSQDTTSSSKRTRSNDDDDDDYYEDGEDGDGKRAKKIAGRRRSQRLRTKSEPSGLKLRFKLAKPSPDTSPNQTPQLEISTVKASSTAPDHRSPLSQSQSTDDFRADEQPQTQPTTNEVKSSITVDARA